MTYCYCRVSTNKQTAKNQKVAIQEWLRRNKTKNPQWIMEAASGRKEPEKRKLGKALESLSEGDILVVTELSRLGRSLIMIFNVLQSMLERKVKVVAIKENFVLKDDVYSKVLAFAFGLSAEIERDLISERTKMGLERARKEGKVLGWKKGVPHKLKLTGKGAYIKRELAKGRSQSELARELKVSWPTMNRFVRLKRLAIRSAKA